MGRPEPIADVLPTDVPLHGLPHAGRRVAILSTSGK